MWKFQVHLFYRRPPVAASIPPLCFIHLKPCNCIKINLFHSSGERTTLTYQIFWYKLYKIGYICLLFTFTFTFSFKFLQTSLIIKELIKHKNKFNRKVFHDRKNSENRFSEFWYFMKYFKKYIMNISRQF